MPGLTPGMSKCSLGAKSKARGVPQRRSSTLSCLVAAVGHLGQGQVGDGEEEVAELGVLGRRPASCQARRSRLSLGDEGAEAFEFGLVAAGLGGARPLSTSALLFGLRGFGREDLRAARLVQRQDLRRQPRQAAAREGGVEGGGVFADGADVVHGGVLRVAVGAPICLSRAGAFQTLFGAGQRLAMRGGKRRLRGSRRRRGPGRARGFARPATGHDLPGAVPLPDQQRARRNCPRRRGSSGRGWPGSASIRRSRRAHQTVRARRGGRQAG